MHLHWRGSANDTQLQFSLQTSNSAATRGPPATNESQALISQLASGTPHSLITATWAGPPPPATPPWQKLSDGGTASLILSEERWKCGLALLGLSCLVLWSIYLPERNNERGKNSSLSEKDLGWGNSDRDYEQNGGEGRAGGVLCNRANRQRVSPIPLIKPGRRDAGRRAIYSCCPVLHKKMTWQVSGLSSKQTFLLYADAENAISKVFLAFC